MFVFIKVINLGVTDLIKDVLRGEQTYLDKAYNKSLSGIMQGPVNISQPEIFTSQDGISNKTVVGVCVSVSKK